MSRRLVAAMIGVVGAIALIGGLMDNGTGSVFAAFGGWLLVWFAIAALLRGGAIVRVGGGFLISLCIAFTLSVSLRGLGLASPARASASTPQHR